MEVEVLLHYLAILCVFPSCSHALLYLPHIKQWLVMVFAFWQGIMLQSGYFCSTSIIWKHFNITSICFVYVCMTPVGLGSCIGETPRNLATGIQGRAPFQFALANMAFACQNRGAIARMTMGPFLDNPKLLWLVYTIMCNTDWLHDWLCYKIQW